MITKNKLDKSFGPVGTSAGIFMFIAGIVVTFYSFAGLILVFIGAFVGFTSTSTMIDNDNKKIKFSNNLFGFIKTGQWIDIKPEMKLGLKKSNRVYRAYSRSNRTLDIDSKDIRLILYGADNKRIMPIKKFDSPGIAKVELKKLGNQLGLSLI
ncbi:MAG: hypothetical protein KAU83_06950 [Bacteroidales bacterium]|nr:hypothetical protein [Bacteroidales bacterium]